MSPHELIVRRISPYRKVTCWTFQPYWLRVIMRDPPEHDSQLTLRSHGRSLTVGSFLTAEERLELAHALRAALDRLRTLTWA